MGSSDNVHVRFPLPDRSYQALVRSQLRQLAITAGFEGHRLGEIEIIIAEITSNIVKHTTKGGVILAKKLAGPEAGIEFIAIDDGPGMRRSAKMMEDGNSTTKTLGQGLGAIRRLSAVFDMFSLMGWGTVLFSRSYIDKQKAPPSSVFEINAICVAKKDQLLCGDAWSARVQGKKTKIALIDGLGHGAPAHAASSLAVEKLDHYSRLSPVEELQALHNELKKTRGAVVTIAHIDHGNNQLLYSGVGNISMKLLTPAIAKGCFSYNGIVGHIMPGFLNNQSFICNEKTDVLIMHSDGIGTRWDVNKYPGILQHHSVLLCAALYKDADRGTDDSTVLVGKMLK
ncbi:MAG TPA: ATP-binding protein [Chitinophagaceae bacterium]|jgi:anti-sigma regulatory factor (Ser/Thr protein kinase)|nr:ATP-binding protein [Chitinophagaceae bacterium]